MIAPSRRLLLRIYAVSLAQLLAIAATVSLVGWLTFKNEPHSGFVNEARYITTKLAALQSHPGAFARELDLVRDIAGARVTVFDGQQSVYASNVEPPLHALESNEYRRLLHEGQFRRGPREGPFAKGAPFVAVMLDRDDPARGYAIFRHARPPPPPGSPVLWVMAIALIAAGLSSVVLARSFVTPLSLLAAAAHKLGEGDLSARVHSSRRDEFGQLADAFDDMADRLTLVLRSQQELLANVSHELRTPLARIRVALDLAAEGDAATAQESLSEITEDLGELERLVADVLQTAKLDLAAGRAGSVLSIRRSERVELTALLDGVETRFRANHPSRELAIERPASAPAVTGDPVLLRRALENLIDNARAYSDVGQLIRVTVAPEPTHVQLCVIDRGIGIPKHDLPNIAKPFFRTDPSRARRTGGLGLGLSLSRRIVEAHGGALVIESELNEGTTVRITLPTAAT